MENLKNKQDFEREKNDVEAKNRKNNLDFLIAKFSEKLSESPINVYRLNTLYGKKLKPAISFDKVSEVRTDESGTGGKIEIIFNYDNYISVYKDRISPSDVFNRDSRISESSYQNILTMANELIKISGYSEDEKNQMFQFVVSYFKDKILTEEELKGIEQ